MSDDYQETANYREEVLKLINEGRIKHTVKWAENASDETLEKIYKNYLTKQSDDTKEQITDTLIKQLSELITSLELIDDSESLKQDLESNELFKRDVKNIPSYVPSYIPFVGLVHGGTCLGKHVMKGENRKMMSCNEITLRILHDEGNY